MVLYVYEVIYAIIIFVSYYRLSLAADPPSREDVIGQYRLTNENQCQRLCWYRQLCSSYSYNYNVAIQSSSNEPNCVLHTESETTATTAPTPPPLSTQPREEKWTQKAAHQSNIHNACRARPCDTTSVCVPHGPSSSSSSSTIALPSFRCLSMPARCGDPPPVANGNVKVLGIRQGDVARVLCDASFVASPRDVPVELTCLVTSQWTPFAGQCLQFEFQVEGVPHFRQPMPWLLLANNSELCAKGLFVSAGQMYVNLQPEMSYLDIDLHLMFRFNHSGKLYGTSWTSKVNGEFQQAKQLGEMPLTPGDPFTLTFRMLTDVLQVTVNDLHEYLVSIGGNSLVESADLSRSKVMVVSGTDVRVDYVNFLTGC